MKLIRRHHALIISMIAVLVIVTFFVAGASNSGKNIGQTGGPGATGGSQDVNVTSPVAGSVYAPGSNMPITWTSSSKVGSTVSIEVDHNGVAMFLITNSTANTGSYTWKVSTSLGGISGLVVRVTSSAKATLNGVSGLFSVSGSIPTPTPSATPVAESIHITSPYAGQSYPIGGVLQMTWNSTGMSQVRLEIRNGTAPYLMICSSCTNTGSYNYSIPAAITPGGNWYVVISDPNNSSVIDSVPFTVTNSMPSPTPTPSPGQPFVHITSPMAGQTYALGTVVPLTWNSTGFSQINLEIRNGSATYLMVCSGCANTGSYNLPLSATSLAGGTNWYVWLSALGNPSVWDSSGPFSVTGAGSGGGGTGTTTATTTP